MKRKHSDKVSSFKRRECSSNDTNSSDLDEEKYKRKRKKREKKSSSSDSGDSSDERRKKWKRTKRKRKKEKKKKRERPEIRESERCFDVPVSLMNPNKEMAPMTKEEWEKRQSVVKRVFDEPSGRYRLIKGDGEVIEEIVSRDRHQEINRQATKGDGAYFQTQLSTNLKK